MTGGTRTGRTKEHTHTHTHASSCILSNTHTHLYRTLGSSEQEPQQHQLCNRENLARARPLDVSTVFDTSSAQSLLPELLAFPSKDRKLLRLSTTHATIGTNLMCTICAFPLLHPDHGPFFAVPLFPKTLKTSTIPCHCTRVSGSFCLSPAMHSKLV